MSNEFICLKQLEEPFAFYSPLSIYNQRGTRYCVIAEGCFIIFKKTNDSIPLYRVPLNKITKIVVSPNTFTIVRVKYKFSFYDKNQELISKWIENLRRIIDEDVNNVITDFHSEVVQIDKIKDCNCPIIVGKTDHRLFIYESYEHQISDICRHVINLQLYNVSSNERRGSDVHGTLNVLILKGPHDQFKFIFSTTSLALEWKGILQSLKFKIQNNPSNTNIIEQIYKNVSNKFCADCNASDPQWVSINMCITLCNNCVGKHRELGTAISRTQSAVLDEKCWKDSLLVRLLIEIGNEHANKFWNKNISNDLLRKTVNIEMKYKNRDFIDTSYSNLSSDELVSKLSISVSTDDIIETMRLWFSSRSNYSKETFDKLLLIARRSNRILQEKFLSLQGNISNSFSSTTENNTKFYEGVFHLSYNNNDKLPNLFLVCLYKDRILIRVENPDLSMKDSIDICVIYLSSIHMVLCDSSKESLQISIYPHCKFSLINKEKNRNSSLNIKDLRLFDSSKISLNKFKIKLFEFLLPNNFEYLTEYTSLILHTDVKINQGGITRCQCHLTLNEITFCSPVDVMYDLTKAEELKMDDDRKGILIRVSKDDVYIQCRDCIETVFRCFDGASKTRLFSLDDDLTGKKLNELSTFIKFRGLNSEGIFRVSGDVARTERLFTTVIESQDKLNIDSNEYTVNDVASCLKKCLHHLTDPLIPESLFIKFKHAAYMENDNDTFEGYVNALKLLPEVNYKILLNLIELMFIVIQSNKVDSENLSQSTASVIFSKKGYDSEDMTYIVKYFIDNFVRLFNYPEEEQLNILIFTGRLSVTPPQSVLRMFLINSSIRSLINPRNIKDVQEMSLPSFGNDVKFGFFTIHINKFEFVRDLQSFLFENQYRSDIDLWYFIDIKNALYKQLLDSNCSIKDGIINQPSLPENYSSLKSMGHFIFMKTETSMAHRLQVESHLCSVKLRNEKYEALISAPNSLKISKSKVKCYDFKLSDVRLYRPHGSNRTKIYILAPDSSVLCCQFVNSDDFKEFLFYFDYFRLKINF